MMANSLYNLMPALVDPTFALRLMDQRLWNEVSLFYKELRNPLFHGFQLADATPDAVFKVFVWMKQIYDWMSGWAPI